MRALFTKENIVNELEPQSSQRLLLIGGDSMSDLIIKRLSVKGIKKFEKLKYDKRKPKMKILSSLIMKKFQVIC